MKYVEIIEKFNPYHSPVNGQFTSAGPNMGGGSNATGGKESNKAVDSKAIKTQLAGLRKANADGFYAEYKNRSALVMEIDNKDLWNQWKYPGASYEIDFYDAKSRQSTKIYPENMPSLKSKISEFLHGADPGFED